MRKSQTTPVRKRRPTALLRPPDSRIPSGVKPASAGSAGRGRDAARTAARPFPAAPGAVAHRGTARGNYKGQCILVEAGILQHGVNVELMSRKDCGQTRDDAGLVLHQKTQIPGCFKVATDF